MAARVIDFQAGAARVRRGSYQKAASVRTRFDHFVSPERTLVGAAPASRSATRVSEQIGNLQEVNVDVLRDALGRLDLSILQVPTQAMSAMLEELSDIRRRISRIEAAVCQPVHSSPNIESLIVDTISEHDRVDSICIGEGGAEELDVFVVVHEHSDDVYDFVADAERRLNEQLPDGPCVTVRVWAHQGRGARASKPPKARTIFLRG